MHSTLTLNKCLQRVGFARKKLVGGMCTEFTQGGDVGTERHIVAHVWVLVGVSEERETHTVANTERVLRSLILLQCKLQQFIFDSIATHYTLIGKRKVSNQCPNMLFASQNPYRGCNILQNLSGILKRRANQI